MSEKCGSAYWITSTIIVRRNFRFIWNPQDRIHWTLATSSQANALCEYHLWILTNWWSIMALDSNHFKLKFCKLCYSPVYAFTLKHLHYFEPHHNLAIKILAWTVLATLNEWGNPIENSVQPKSVTPDCEKNEWGLLCMLTPWLL